MAGDGPKKFSIRPDSRPNPIILNAHPDLDSAARCVRPPKFHHPGAIGSEPTVAENLPRIEAIRQIGGAVTCCPADAKHPRIEPTTDARGDLPRVRAQSIAVERHPNAMVRGPRVERGKRPNDRNFRGALGPESAVGTNHTVMIFPSKIEQNEPARPRRGVLGLVKTRMLPSTGQPRPPVPLAARNSKKIAPPNRKTRCHWN